MISRSTRRLVVLLTIFLLALPVAAWANSVSFQTTGGQITSNGTVLNIKASPIIRMAGLPGPAATRNLGWASLTTGALLSGNLATGATFAAGGSFTLNGANGIPGGVIFSGWFVSPVMWSATFHPTANAGHGAWYYTLTRTVGGTLSDGRNLRGKIRFATTDVPRGAEFSSLANLEDGSGEVIVPEPSTLALLASGLTGLAMLVRRKGRM